MAALFDTSILVLLLRRRPPEHAAAAILAARAEIQAGTALLPAPSLTELLIGERDPQGVERLASALERLPTVVLSAEAARLAGTMGAFLVNCGASIPYPDLQIAATALWLDVPLLSWDSDYARARDVALSSASAHAGAAQWRRLELHAASRVG